MNDKLILDNYLLILKSTVEVYIHGTLESSNNDIRELLKDSLDNIINMQEECYSKMTECGYYQINNIKSTKIKETYKKLINQNS